VEKGLAALESRFGAGEITTRSGGGKGSQYKMDDIVRNPRIIITGMSGVLEHHPLMCQASLASVWWHYHDERLWPDWVEEYRAMTNLRTVCLWTGDHLEVGIVSGPPGDVKLLWSVKYISTVLADFRTPGILQYGVYRGAAGMRIGYVHATWERANRTIPVLVQFRFFGSASRDEFFSRLHAYVVQFTDLGPTARENLNGFRVYDGDDQARSGTWGMRNVHHEWTCVAAGPEENEGQEGGGETPFVNFARHPAVRMPSIRFVRSGGERRF
jgi:hypothetical protein